MFDAKDRLCRSRMGRNGNKINVVNKLKIVIKITEAQLCS
jgi:hypothetical protein